ncbi:nuclear receptor-binding factor 2-like [Lutzomyia longipalpis]|uniref:Nuclear receptor-binding factor 2 MIT domain-containing protein n=2 Tax=Lutzomyia longipalpis TaxID=7200 RepID=A0A1B0CJC9_LUTLO|nr:nuclear receptor-binding factor 2-like [Lutzomyia longipalpis]
MMDNSALNTAHRYARRAEAHFRYKRFDEAIECHKQVIEQLQNAIRLATVDKSVVSLQLQREYHVKQIEFLNMRKMQFEKYRKAIEQEKGSDFWEQKEKTRTNQTELFKAIENSDALLAGLLVKSSSGQMEVENITETLRELQSINKQIHIFAHSLSEQLDGCIIDADVLREKIRAEMAPKDDDSDDKEASSVRSLSPDKQEYKAVESLDNILQDLNEIQELPNLPPLQLPNFDYSRFSDSGTSAKSD